MAHNACTCLFFGAALLVVVVQQGRSDSDAVWVYTADDFSEEELQRTTFGIKFKDAEVRGMGRKTEESMEKRSA